LIGNDRTIYSVKPDGTRTAVKTSPTDDYYNGAAFDDAGNFYYLQFAYTNPATGRASDALMKMTPSGTITVLATWGDPNVNTHPRIANGNGHAGGWNANASSVAVDPNGNLYVSMINWGELYKVTPQGVVSLVASTDGIITDVVADKVGNVYFNQNTGGIGIGNSIKRIDSAGNISTYWQGDIYSSVYERSLTLDPNGRLYATITNGPSDTVRPFYAVSPVTPAGSSGVGSLTGIFGYSIDPTGYWQLTGAAAFSAAFASNGDLYAWNCNTAQVMKIQFPAPTAPTISNVPTSAAFGGSFTPTFSGTNSTGQKGVTSSTPAVCSVTPSTNLVSYVGGGTCTLKATVNASATYGPADGSEQSFTVSKGSASKPTISNLPVSKAVGGSFTPVVSTTGDGVKSVTSSTPSVCSVDAGVVSFVAVGSCTLVAHVADGVNTGPADSVNLSVTVTAALTAPVSVSAVAGVASAKVSFGAPLYNGGYAITGYKVTATNLSRPLAAPVTATGTSSPLTVSGLTNGDQYSFTVSVSNADGVQVTSAVSNTVTPATLGTMVVTSLPNALQASWQALSSGLADHYVVETVSGDGTTCSVVGTSCVVGELDNGVSQVLQISAFDASGTLIFQSTFQAASPKDVPDAPLQVSAVPGDGSATISWGVPDSQGSAIISYTVTDSSGKTCQTSGTSCSISGLVAGTRDRFTVRATNAVGTSVASDASEFITISATPVKPSGVSVAPADRSLVVSWLASGTNGGSAISYYMVTDSQGHYCVGTPETLTCTLLNVTNNVSDVVTVTAINDDGLMSVQSVAVTAVAGTVPGAPTNVVATSGVTSSTVSWSAPDSDGGSAITSYVVTGSDGATCSVAASQTSCVITNLVGGASQTFTVVAVNSFGSSMASSDVSATAFDVPGRPTNVRAGLQNDGSITVVWAAPSGNGSAVTSYTVTSNRGDTCVASGSATVCNFSGLTQGLGYAFTVVATNGAGDSLGSVPSSTVVDANVPAAPSQVVVDAGDQAVLVSWSTPSSNGSDILSYVVTASTGQRCETDQTSCLIAGFTNGTSVTFTVVAVNGAGVSAASPVSAAVVPAGAPSIPANLAVVSALHGAVSLRWDAAVSNGSPVTGYVVNDANGHQVCAVSTTSCTITGLTNGKTYSYSVLSRSAAGDSDRSGSVSARPITVPSVPTRVSAVAGDGAVTIKFSQSANDGGSVITAYTVTDSYGTVCSLPAATSCRFTGLTNGTADTFSVTATNAAGTSVAVVVTAMPFAAPFAPTNVRAVALNGSALVSWDAAFANGSAITSYTVTSSDAKTCVARTSTSCLVSGLINGTSYTFTVKAINVVGMSAPSVASASVIPVTTPSAPRGLVATVGDKSVSFVWNAPSRNGGTPILGYVVADRDGKTCTTTDALTCSISGLTNGQSYTFTVAARNAVGFSGASSAVTVTPITVASAPTVSSISPVAGGLKVSFTAPASDGGSAVTRYQVSTDSGVTWKSAALSSVKASSFIVGGLSGGTTYGVSMRAFNDAGVSAASDVVNAIYIATPGAPRITSAVVSGTSVKVRYTAPTVTGGETPTMYQYSLDGGVTWRVRPAGTATEFMLTNLPKASTLKLSMRAVNSRGYGTASGILTLKVK